jgi:hypothetical protein
MAVLVVPHPTCRDPYEKHCQSCLILALNLTEAVILFLAVAMAPTAIGLADYSPSTARVAYERHLEVGSPQTKVHCQSEPADPVRFGGAELTYCSGNQLVACLASATSLALAGTCSHATR